MQDFDFNLRTRMVRGAGSLGRIGELAGELGTRRALVVTDPGIMAAGHVDRALRALKAANIETFLFDGAHENPTTDDIESGLEIAKRHEPELLIGLGVEVQWIVRKASISFTPTAERCTTITEWVKRLSPCSR